MWLILVIYRNRIYLGCQVTIYTQSFPVARPPRDSPSRTVEIKPPDDSQMFLTVWGAVERIGNFTNGFYLLILGFAPSQFSSLFYFFFSPSTSYTLLLSTPTSSQPSLLSLYNSLLLQQINYYTLLYTSSLEHGSNQNEEDGNDACLLSAFFTPKNLSLSSSLPRR